MTEEEGLIIRRAVIGLLSQVEELSASHISLMRFFLSKWPSLADDERETVATAIHGFEARQWHLRGELRSLQDLLRD